MTSDDALGQGAMKLADMAMKTLDSGDKLSFPEVRTAAFTRASALAALALVAEVRELRKAVEALQPNEPQHT